MKQLENKENDTVEESGSFTEATPSSGENNHPNAKIINHVFEILDAYPNVQKAVYLKLCCKYGSLNFVEKEK